MKVKKIILMLTVLVTFSLHTAQAKDLVMGLIPAENSEEITQRFEPMRVYLEKKTGKKIKMFMPENYSSLIKSIRKGHVDFAWFGPLSYVLAESDANIEVFAVGVRKETGLSSYRSLLMVAEGSTAQTIAELEDKKMAFVDRSSTSGGLVPTALVKKETGMMPREFFSKVRYVGSHDAAVLAVKNKTVDVAASNEMTYNKLVKKGLITEKSNRILQYSNPIPGFPLAYRKNLDKVLKDKLRDAILNVHNEMEDIAGYGSLIKYEAADPKDYQVIRDLVKNLVLGRDAILK